MPTTEIGKYHYMMNASVPNFNDTGVVCYPPTTLAFNGNAKIVFVDRISIYWETAASTITGLIYIGGSPLDNLGVYWDAFNTAGVSRRVDVYYPGVPLGPRWISIVKAGAGIGRRIVTLSLVGGYAATDDVHIGITGRVYTNEGEATPSVSSSVYPTPQPVSLEAYRWPLTRRV